VSSASEFVDGSKMPKFREYFMS